MTRRKDPAAVALGRKGGAATKGISTPAKRRAAKAANLARWAKKGAKS